MGKSSVFGDFLHLEVILFTKATGGVFHDPPAPISPPSVHIFQENPISKYFKYLKGLTRASPSDRWWCARISCRFLSGGIDSSCCLIFSGGTLHSLWKIIKQFTFTLRKISFWQWVSVSAFQFCKTTQTQKFYESKKITRTWVTRLSSSESDRRPI